MYQSKQELHRLDGFFLVVVTWLLLCFYSALPFYFALPHASCIDIAFDAVSGLTTTGAEAFNNIEQWNHSLRFYHQFLQFLGGLGIIVLGLAIMPLLSQTGSTLFNAETPGPAKDQKLTPRIHETAKLLWRLYAGLMLTCAVCYHLAGMAWFDSFCYAFSTVSTGGFGIHHLNIGHFHNTAILWVASFFMLLGSMNFGLHLLMIKQRSLKALASQLELHTFIKLIGIALILCMGNQLWHQPHLPSFNTFSKIVMTCTAMLSTTGLQTTSFALWPTFSPYLLMLMAMIGGCSGSTTGGIKVARWMVIKKEAVCLIKQTLHPRAVVSVFQEKTGISEQMIATIRGFLCLTLILFATLLVAFMALGYPFDVAFAAIAACLSNVGVSINELAHGYHHLNDPAKMLLIGTMLLGRLEITTLIIVLTPYYWREY